MRISDWSSDVCSSDLGLAAGQAEPPRPGETPALVVCNGPALSDERIAIVDPATQDRCPDGKVGEIWVIGPNVADSYYNDAKRTGATFGAAIGGAEPDPGPGSEEHTSELQSLMRISYAVFCLKKKNTNPEDNKHKVRRHPRERTKDEKTKKSRSRK